MSQSKLLLYFYEKYFINKYFDFLGDPFYY